MTDRQYSFDGGYSFRLRPAEWNLPEIRAAFKTLRILANRHIKSGMFVADI